MNDTDPTVDRRRLALLGLAAHRFRVKAMFSTLGWLNDLAERDASVAPIAELNRRAGGAAWALENAIRALEGQPDA